MRKLYLGKFGIVNSGKTKQRGRNEFIVRFVRAGGDTSSERTRVVSHLIGPVFAFYILSGPTKPEPEIGCRSRISPFCLRCVELDI